MKKFIVIYHAPQSVMESKTNASPEDREKGMEPWMAWAKKCGSGLVDMGTPLGNAHKMSKDEHGESKSDVVGYSILQAESWDDLKEMMEGHPHLGWGAGCEIEIHESLPLPAM
jgi:hypothetical protein